MVKSTHFLLLSLLLLNQALAQSPLFLENQEELDQARELTERLEFDFGRLDPRLLEPLEQYSRELMAAEQYPEAHDALDQMVQIIRVEEGLYSSAQFPHLLARIEAYGNQRDWQGARETMDHVNWLINRPENQLDETLLDSMQSLSQLHMWGVASDYREWQRYHFMAAQRLANTSIQVARALWGDEDPRLAPLMYQRLLQYYQQAAIVDRGGPTAMDLRRYSFSGGMARSRSDTMAGYYYSGLRHLNEIRRHFISQEPVSVEALALTELYIGDWYVLFNNSESASRAYRNSNDLLLQAGIAQDAINRYFAQPKMLPAPAFHQSWQDVLESLDQAGNDEDMLVVANFSFRQWTAQFPHVRAPEQASADPQRVGEDYALFSFNLTGLEEVSRWYRGRLKKSVSVPRNLQVLERQISPAVDWMQLEDMVLDFRFRPRLVDGVPQNSTATLRYHLAP